MNNQQRLLAFFFSLLGSSVAGFFGRFLGSEGLMITGKFWILFAIVLFSLIFLFRFYSFHLVRLSTCFFLYISILV